MAFWDENGIVLGQKIKFGQNTWNYWDIKWNYREKNKIIGTNNKTVWTKIEAMW